jgi:hypothetical protein
MRANLKTFGVLLAAITLTSCGGGGGGSSGNSGGGSTTPPVSNASPGGIWSGRDPITGFPVLAVVAEDGRTQVVVDDGFPFTQYWGTLGTSGNNITSSTFQVADTNVYYGTATVTGTVAARSSLSLNVSFTPAAGCPAATCGTARSASGTLSFDTLYNRGGALSRVVGNWRDLSTTQVWNINSSGVVFQQDAATGCIINGQISTINTQYNAYSATYTFQSCRIPYTQLNGTTATGLVVVDDVRVPNRIYLGAQYRSGGVAYTVYGVADKT